MLGWMVRNPYRAAIAAGILVALLFGWVSFPTEKTLVRTVDDWLPSYAKSLDSVAPEALAVLDAVARGEFRDKTVKVSPQEFSELPLPVAYVYPQLSGDGREFRIQYTGLSAAGDSVYLAERKVAAASGLDPARWFYKAVEAEADRAGNVLNLTYERDVTGLLALLLLDLVVGGIYGAMVGMILAVLGTERLDKAHAPKSIPGPSPLTPLGPRGIFRA